MLNLYKKLNNLSDKVNPLLVNYAISDNSILKTFSNKIFKTALGQNGSQADTLEKIIIIFRALISTNISLAYNRNKYFGLKQGLNLKFIDETEQYKTKTFRKNNPGIINPQKFFEVNKNTKKQINCIEISILLALLINELEDTTCHLDYIGATKHLSLIVKINSKSEYYLLDARKDGYFISRLPRLNNEENLMSLNSADMLKIWNDWHAKIQRIQNSLKLPE